MSIPVLVFFGMFGIMLWIGGIDTWLSWGAALGVAALSAAAASMNSDVATREIADETKRKNAR